MPHPSPSAGSRGGSTSPTVNEGAVRILNGVGSKLGHNLVYSTIRLAISAKFPAQAQVHFNTNVGHPLYSLSVTSPCCPTRTPLRCVQRGPDGCEDAGMESRRPQAA